MKRLLTICMMIMGLSMAHCKGARSPDVPQREASALSQHLDNVTVALVRTTSDGDVRVYCTGVWVSEDEILTAHHCVKGVAELIAEEKGEDPEALEPLGYEGTPIHYIVSEEQRGVGENPSAIHLGKAVKLDMSHDLALVKVELKSLPNHEIAKLVKTTPGVGEKIHVVGHVKGLYWSHVDGIVAAYRDTLPGSSEREGPYMQVSAPVYFGNSGGGVFDEDGNLAGIASFIISAPNTAFFIHATSIKAFLA